MSGKKGRSGAKKSTVPFPIEEAIRLRSMGLSLVKIGKKIKRSHMMVAVELRKNGIEIRRGQLLGLSSSSNGCGGSFSHSIGTS